MNERIKEIRKFLKLTQAQFAHEIRLSNGSLSNIEAGKAPITERTIFLICSQFNVNENWLRFGTDEMFNIIDKNYDEFFEIFSQLSLPLQDFLISVAKELLKRQDKL